VRPESRAREATVVAVVTLVAIGCGRSQAESGGTRLDEPPRANGALGLTFRASARVRADRLRFAEGRTLALRFLAAHTTVFRGALVSDSGGQFHAALAPFGSLGEPGLEVRIADTTTTLRLDERPSSVVDRPFEPPRWRTLALSLAGGKLEVSIDGRRLISLATNGREPAGDLVLGHLAQPGAVADQFYGLIDDLRVYEPVLEASRTDELPTPMAAVGFDLPEAGNDADGLTLHENAEIVPVSTTLDSEQDRRMVPPPRHLTRLSPPFGLNQVWRVLQSIDSGRSHRDEAAFALDLAPVVTAAGADGSGAEILAAAGGEVSAVVDCFPDDNGGPCPATAYSGSNRPAPAGSAENRNLMCLRHLQDEHTCYVHVENQSSAFPRAATVRRGAVLARVGKTGTREPHLHFALSDLPESSEPGAFSDLVTRPFVFDRYQVSNDEGRTWQTVSEALPRRGQWIRR
jgi:murein DD-endopeptidase MepM/ murein hydrolase activator NlpD